MSYRLPPLTTLRLFEAAARRLSFKLAAEELNITASAVSHGIQTLEAWLGVRLFLRRNRGLSLTGAGASFLPQVQQALSLLAKAAANVPGRAPSGKLAVSCAPTFMSRWLLPNLPAFRDRHPAIDVTIDTRHALVDFPRDGVDLGIRMGRGPWQELYALKLVGERLVPVCAPALAARIRTPADLAGATLLQVTSVSNEWPAWFEAKGIEPVTPARTMTFDTVHMALDAAASGLGIALGRTPLIDRDLASGALVSVLGPAEPCATGYWLVAAPESLAKPEVAAFRDWIFQALDDQPR